jgi:hypothetical protein
MLLPLARWTNLGDFMIDFYEAVAPARRPTWRAMNASPEMVLSLIARARSFQG